MTEELKPCPKCNGVVSGRLGGGIASFGCAEYEYEVECECGILFNHSCVSEDAEDAEREGIEAWNTRYKRTVHLSSKTIRDDEESKRCNYHNCPDCGHLICPTFDKHCPNCGAEVIDGDS